jgi:hypothetical protein
MSADPAGPVDGVNLYVYVSNNPVRKVDPTGNQEAEGVDLEYNENAVFDSYKSAGATEYEFEDEVIKATGPTPGEVTPVNEYVSIYVVTKEDAESKNPHKAIKKKLKEAGFGKEVRAAVDHPFTNPEKKLKEGTLLGIPHWKDFSDAEKAEMRADLESMAEDAANNAGIRADIFKALVHYESKWDPASRSPAHAMGLTQVKDTEAKKYGISEVVEKGERYDPAQPDRYDTRYDPKESLEAGAKYLKELYDLTKRRMGAGATTDEIWKTTLASYNIGVSAVRNAINSFKKANAGQKPVSLKDFSPHIQNANVSKLGKNPAAQAVNYANKIMQLSKKYR